MLVKFSELIKKAHENQYAVPALGAINELTCKAGIKAAEEMNSPLILLCMEKGNDNMEYFGRILTDMASKSKIPVATMYDHTASFESAIMGIRSGFSAVMVDRSQKPYNENVEQVKELVKIAHAVDVEIEAELGHVGYGERGADDPESVLTIPEEAIKFVEKTQIDCLAIAIGTAHGVYRGKPELHFNLLEEIEKKITVPLALHGGSGTGDDNLSKACQKGISKVNIVNDLYRGAYNAVATNGMEGNQIYGLFPTLSMGYIETAKHYIQIIGSANKA